MNVACLLRLTLPSPLSSHAGYERSRTSWFQRPSVKLQICPSIWLPARGQIVVCFFLANLDSKPQVDPSLWGGSTVRLSQVPAFGHCGRGKLDGKPLKLERFQHVGGREESTGVQKPLTNKHSYVACTQQRSKSTECKHYSHVDAIFETVAALTGQLHICRDGKTAKDNFIFVGLVK